MNNQLRRTLQGHKMKTHSCNKTARPFNPLFAPQVNRPLEGREKKLVDDILSSIIQPEAVVENIITGTKFIAVTASGRM